MQPTRSYREIYYSIILFCRTFPHPTHNLFGLFIKRQKQKTKVPHLFSRHNYHGRLYKARRVSRVHADSEATRSKPTDGFLCRGYAFSRAFRRRLKRVPLFHIQSSLFGSSNWALLIFFFHFLFLNARANR